MLPDNACMTISYLTLSMDTVIYLYRIKDRAARYPRVPHSGIDGFNLLDYILDYMLCGLYCVLWVTVLLLGVCPGVNVPKVGGYTIYSVYTPQNCLIYVSEVQVLFIRQIAKCRIIQVQPLTLRLFTIPSSILHCQRRPQSQHQRNLDEMRHDHRPNS